MSSSVKCPNPNIVLNGLKDFQRNTVEYVFKQLYDNGGSGRFLVADEVGLGKTLVARGLIARAIDHLWHTIDRIDIIYICSNADIARQNINRLSIPGLSYFSPIDRITLLPIASRTHSGRSFKEERVNFIPLTPGTSFNLGFQTGVWKERALLYWLIKPLWNLEGVAPLNLLRVDMNKDNFRYHVNSFAKWYCIDNSLADDFRRTLQEHVAQQEHNGQPSIRQRFDELCDRFRRARKHIPWSERSQQKSIVGELRQILASTCVNALEPDLIILDEFQRFKHLLDGGNPVGELALKLFEHHEARTLLLSATPYKMYTLPDELDQDNHYKDFLKTIGFLYDNDSDYSQFKELLTRYRRELYRLGDTTNRDKTSLLDTKRTLETNLRRVIARTEKLAVSADRNGMLQEIIPPSSYLEPQDLETYVSLQQIASLLKQYSTLEYWKSAPYLLNFMENYRLKRVFTDAIKIPERSAELADVLTNSDHLLLSHDDIVKYNAIDPGNARLRHLLADSIDIGAWQMLWLPPSLPYYVLAKPFADNKLQQFTKRLIFSAWQVVPKMVASLVSYEAERQMVRSFEKEPENTLEARKRRRGLLRFSREDGRLTGMPVLGMLYPSITLARECDPLHYCANKSLDEVPPLEALVAYTQGRIDELLTALKLPQTEQGPSDEAWYWAAPILLDLHFYPESTRAWWQTENLAGLWMGDEDVPSEEDEDSSLWAAHVTRVRELLDGDIPKSRPPDDLALVLTQTAIAGPGVASLRALSRITGGSETLLNPDLRLSAASIAWAFRSLFNVPEVMALLRGMNNREPYWRRVLEYCVAGGLQSVLDEYAHVLRESRGLLNQGVAEVAMDVAKVMRSAIQLRPASLKIDDFRVTPETNHIDLAEYRLRTHFALRFGDERSDDDKTLTRKESVREAFNSPFWPFVLVSTSVGQEGLDFHLYCHAIMHWNLPSNPVDLEQREGRVHRYKGHAVRKNLAHDKGQTILTQFCADPWHELFKLASIERQPDTTDLVPFWIYPENGKAKAFIERHVPALPLSKDIQRLNALRKSLTVYRMVFGQNRQEDLVAYLLERMSEDEISALINELQINLEPPRFTKR